MVHDGAVRRPLEVRERGEVRREERQRFCFRGEVFTNRRGDGSPVAGRSPAANLVDADERPRRRAADQLGGLAHLALECGLAGARVVAGADARHNAIKDGEPRACVRGHKRPDVRQHRRHRRRAHERRLAAHVRPGEEEHVGGGPADGDVVADDVTAKRLEARVRAASDLDERLGSVDHSRAAEALAPRDVGEGEQRVERGDAGHGGGPPSARGVKRGEERSELVQLCPADAPLRSLQLAQQILRFASLKGPRGFGLLLLLPLLRHARSAEERLWHLDEVTVATAHEFQVGAAEGLLLRLEPII
mmetsp:Transcript_26384/g.88709  ORF Transcript_26384/g.88709 Transcript_26384/m.88709 type:complete len:304 (-) Transcript_26384:970-1881(-)